MFLKPPPGVVVPVHAAPIARSTIALLALALLAPFALYFGTVRSIISIWNSSETFAHGYVILPLAFRISLPALNNNLVNLVKTTTIAYAIAVPEMLYVANQIWSDELNVPEMMNVLLVIYVALVGVVVYVMGRWERAMRVPGYMP